MLHVWFWRERERVPMSTVEPATHLGGRLSDYRTSVILSTIPCHCVWYSSRWAAIGLPYFCYTVNNTLPLCVILISVGGYRITVLLLYCQQYPAIVCDTYLGGRLSDYRTSVILSTIPCHCVWYLSRWAAIGLPYFCYTVNNTLPLCVILILGKLTMTRFERVRYVHPASLMGDTSRRWVFATFG